MKRLLGWAVLVALFATVGLVSAAAYLARLDLPLGRQFGIWAVVVGYQLVASMVCAAQGRRLHSG